MHKDRSEGKNIDVWGCLGGEIFVDRAKKRIKVVGIEVESEAKLDISQEYQMVVDGVWVKVTPKKSEGPFKNVPIRE